MSNRPASSGERLQAGSHYAQSTQRNPLEIGAFFLTAAVILLPVVIVLGIVFSYLAFIK